LLPSRFHIGDIKEDCDSRLNKQKKDDYHNFGEVKERDWTEMFFITDYKNIIDKHWTAKPENDVGFKTFEEHFSIKIGPDFKTKTTKINWLTKLNIVRRDVGHEGSKDTGITREDLAFLENVHSQLDFENVNPQLN